MTCVVLCECRFLQHLPARITCGWSGEPLKCCRCVHCFPECIYCQARNDACSCVNDWRHPMTNPSADEDELNCELHREEREDVALLEWNFLPGYKVKEERVPGSYVDEDELPVFTPLYSPAYQPPHWKNLETRRYSRSWRYFKVTSGRWQEATEREASRGLGLQTAVHCQCSTCVNAAEELATGLSPLSLRPPARILRNQQIMGPPTHR